MYLLSFWSGKRILKLKTYVKLLIYKGNYSSDIVSILKRFLHALLLGLELPEKDIKVPEMYTFV